MELTDILAITPIPVISGLIWIVLVVAVLYLARPSAHKLILIVTRALRDAMNAAAESAGRGKQGLEARNREVLLAAGREAKERIIEREFDRVGDSVNKDLSGYPALQRKLSEAATRIEEDHQKAVDVPPDPPGWAKAVEAVAKVGPEGDPAVGSVLVALGH